MTPIQYNISIDELLPFNPMSKGIKPSYDISSYLQQLLEKHGSQEGKVIYLPSLMQLAGFFQMSHLQVHDAFQYLRQDGYDYELKGMDMAIPFWNTAHLEKAPQKLRH